MTQSPAMPGREQCVLRELLDRRARQTPDKTFVLFESGERWSYAEFRRRVRARAGGLKALGVNQGDHVLVWLPNGPECLLTWFGINYLGAVYVPVNTAYRGGVLEHAVALSDARLGVVHGDLIDRLVPIGLAAMKTVVAVQGGAGTRLGGAAVLDASVLDVELDAPASGGANAAHAALPAGGDDPLALARPIEPWDTHAIIFTSGTTGPSKGVMSSYAHLYASGKGFPLACGEDRHLVALPLFHAGGTIPISLMLTLGGSVVLVGSFNTERFWQTVRDTQTTSLILLGVMAAFLVKRADADEGRGSPLRWVLALPLDEDGIEFGRRYDVQVTTTFNMTEVSCPIVSDVNPTVAGSCGVPRPGVQARLVDANDCEVADGEVGELMLRTDLPWAMNSGYYKNPEATARAWRNGWFHTGDAFRRDAQGMYFFVDRMKDAIRRRGENVSSFEVEAEILAHPAIREAAAVAVPSEYGEDEVLVGVSLRPGQALDPAQLIEFLRDRMAHFMIPRYVRILDELPKTPTQKVQKHLIRKDGVTADTWDREAAGIVVRREKLVDHRG